MFFKQYDAMARQFYNLVNCGVRNNTAFKYISYGYNISRVYFPKVSYQNPYESEYTKPTIKYNYIIIYGLIGLTLLATKAKVNSYYSNWNKHDLYSTYLKRNLNFAHFDRFIVFIRSFLIPIWFHLSTIHSCIKPLPFYIILIFWKLFQLIFPSSKTKNQKIFYKEILISKL